MRKLRAFLFLTLFIGSFKGLSQPIGNFRTSNPTFKEIRDSFNAYWSTRPIERGKGYKPFKRWEWYWETRLLQDGSFPSPSINADNLEVYKRLQRINPNRVESSANWTSVGPSTSQGGYHGIGRVNCIAFHPTNPNIFWIGTPAGGIWKTTNGGNSWQNSQYEFQYQSLGVSDIAVDPLNPNILYIATGDGDQGSLSSLTGGAQGDTKSIGILKSFDGGSTWSLTGMNWSLTESKLIRRLIINPSNPAILLAATSDGIWRTSDAGMNWSRMSSTTGYHFMDVEFKPNDPNVVYASTFVYPNCTVNLFRSTNGGIDWSVRATIDSAYRANIAVTPAWPELVDVLVAQCDDGASNLSNDRGLRGLWYSSNSGSTFSLYYSPLANANGCGSPGIQNITNGNLLSSYGGQACGGQGEYDLAYAINPNNYNEIWLGGVNSWQSLNGGTSWTLKTIWSDGIFPSVTTVHADKHFIAFHPLLPNTVFECNDGGLYKTTDGGTTWQDLTNGIVSSQIYKLGVAQTQTSRIINGLQDNGTKYYNNNNWIETTGGDGMSCAIDYANANIQYSSIQNGNNLYRTTDAWVSGSSIRPPLNILLNTEIRDNVPSGAWVTPFAIDPSNPQVLYIGYQRLYKSTNRGDTWVHTSSPISPGNDLRQIAISPSNSNIIYVTTFDSIYRSLNGGVSWNTVAYLGVPRPAAITSLTVHPLDPLIIYLTVGGYSANNKVYKSTNGGLTWTNYSGSLPNVPVNCLVYQNGSSEGLYIGTDVGVFYRNSTLGDWIEYQQGLPHVVITDLEISYQDSKLWAATFGRGLWNSALYVPPIKPIIIPSNDTTICQGQQLQLTAPSSFQVYQWSNGASTQSITVTQAGGYSVRVIDGLGNISYWSDTINVQVDLPPNVPTITRQNISNSCIGQQLLLSSSAASAYQWYRNDTLIQNATNQTYQPSVNAEYRVRVYSANRACSTLSDTVIINLSGLNISGIISQDTIRVCNADSVTINASSGFTSYLWSNGANTANIRVGNSGLYSLQAICGVNSSNNSYVQFNQSGNITIPDAAQLRFTDQMTMMFKVKIDGSIPAGLPTLIDRVNSNDFQFTLDGLSTRFNFRYAGVSNGLGVYYTLTAAQVQNAQWIYMAIVKTPDSLFMYANGQLVDRIRSTVPFTANTNSINIGGTGTYFGRFRGGFDNLSFWNRRLNASEISQYQECMSGREIGCVGFYKFENPSPVADYSSFSNTAIQNATILNYPSSQVTVCTGQTFTDSVYVSIISSGIAQNDTTVCRSTPITLSASSNASANNICSIAQLPLSLRSGIVAYYPFCATTSDASGNNYHGLNNGAIFVPDRYGNANSALDFSGANSNVILANSFNAANITSELTVGMWVYLRPVSSGNSGMLFYSGNGEWGVSYDNSSIGFSVKLSDGQWWSADMPVSPLMNKWVYIVGQYKKGDYIKIYADGNLGFQLLIPNLNLYRPNITSYIGSSYANTRFANARIDDVIVYNRALSAAELNMLIPQQLSYQWSNGAITTSISVTPTQSTTYYLTTSDGIASCIDSVRVTIATVDTAVAVLDPLSICIGSGQVRLQAALGLSYQWLRNGVPISGATSRIYTATQAGQYRVALSNSITCRDTSGIVTVVENPKPLAAFTTNVANQCLSGNLYNFTNNSSISSGVISYLWSFGDGNTATTSNATYSYTTAGTYTVKLVVTSSLGCKDSTTRSVTVFPKPAVDFTANSLSQCVNGNSFVFTNNSTISTGTITYIWRFGDGNSATTTNASYTYTLPGTYVVKLIATSNNGCSDSTTRTVTVNPKPTVDFSINNPAQCLSVNQFVFTNNSTISAGTLSHTWDFGNGALSLLSSPTYTYANPGSFTVKLVSISAAGCKDSISRQVTVHPMPTGILSTPSTNLLCEGSNLLLSATGGNSYQWFLNGGAIPGAVNATHSATQPGVYTVNVISSNGCVSPATGSVTLQLVVRPTVNFVYDKYCAGFPTLFANQSNTSNSDIVSYSWSFGQGQATSTLQSPSYTFSTAGVYNVSLTVTPLACPSLAASLSKPVTIVPPPPNQRYTALNAVENRDLQLDARSSGGANYIWSPPSGLSNPAIPNPIFNYNAEVDYIVTITTGIGCIIKDTQLVRIFKEKEIYVPKGFSPNADGNNDKIFPRLVGVRTLSYFKVYNRWGQLLYQTSNPDEGWDGTFRGVKQPMETYVWMAEGIDMDNNIIRRTGNFLLLR